MPRVLIHQPEIHRYVESCHILRNNVWISREFLNTIFFQISTNPSIRALIIQQDASIRGFIETDLPVIARLPRQALYDHLIRALSLLVPLRGASYEVSVNVLPTQPVYARPHFFQPVNRRPHTQPSMNISTPADARGRHGHESHPPLSRGGHTHGHR